MRSPAPARAMAAAWVLAGLVLPGLVLPGPPARAAAPSQAPVIPPDLTVRLDDGATFTPYFLSDVDQGSVAESAPGGQAAGLNLRRMQLGGHLKLPAQVELGFVWDFGHSPGGRGRVLEAQVSYSGFKPITASVGIFKPQFSQESVQNGSDIPFLERASIVNVARNLAASSGREAAQVAGFGDRWLAGVALTAGLTGQSGSSGQRAVVGRGSVLLVRTDALTLQVGASAEYVFQAPNAGGRGPTLALANTLELGIDTVAPSVSTGPVPVHSAVAAGPEASLSWRNLLVQGEAYQIEFDRRRGGGAARFGGWYAQALYMVAGPPRTWDPGSGVWLPPKLPHGFDPRHGYWGSVELGVRYSQISLNAGGIDGGRQGIWSLVASYWPMHQLRLMGELLHADVAGGQSPRRADAVAGRFQLLF